MKIKQIAALLAAAALAVSAAGCGILSPAGAHLPAATEVAYASLDSSEAALYDRMTSALYRHDALSIPIFEGIKAERLLLLHDYVMADHPDIFWVGDIRYTTVGGYCVEYSPQYDCEKKEAAVISAAIEEKASEIVKAASVFPLDYDRAVFVHDYIINSSEYDNEASNEARFDIRGIFVGGRAVCAGYAKAFQLIMQRLSIDCVYVTGMAGQVPHGWNLVRLGGDYTGVDTTYDDPSTDGGGDALSHAYFGFTNQELSGERTVDGNYPYPPSTAMRYLDRKGLSGKGLADIIEKVAEAAAANIKAGQSWVEFISESAQSDIDDARLLSRLINRVNQLLGGGYISYSVRCGAIDSLKTARIYFERLS